MDYKIIYLVFGLLAGGFAFPVLEDESVDMSVYFTDHTDPNARIVGGTQAAARSHPHMVALTHGVSVRHFLCGGSLVTRRSILTAAHCVHAVRLSATALQNHVRATVGTNRWNSGGTHYNLLRHATHPQFSNGQLLNDISLVITTSNVVMNNNVRVVPITYGWVFAGTQTRVAGWGLTRAGGAVSSNLLEITVNTIDGNDCVRRAAQASSDFNIFARRVDPNREICTFHAPGRGTCNGDSGSPLLRVDNRHQIGIVSWGFPCARGAPDMFVRISAHQHFIQSNLVN